MIYGYAMKVHLFLFLFLFLFLLLLLLLVCITVQYFRKHFVKSFVLKLFRRISTDVKVS